MKKNNKDLQKTEQVKKLFRSKENKIISGVCGGMGEYFNIDPIWIRLAFALLIFAEGIGLIIYVVAWLLIPENPSQKTGVKTKAEHIVEKASKGKSGNFLLGILLIAFGLLFLVKNIFSWFSWKYVWPAGIIALGIALMWRKEK